MPTRLDLSGRRFGRWIVLTPERSRLDRTYWFCRCDCGAERVVSTQTLRMGLSQSCGCLRPDVSSSCNRTHGASVGSKATKEYQAWTSAKQRCYSPRNKSFKDYGRRGITMCDRWRESASAFLADMGPCPPGYSLHRIDNDGPYSPDNCKWASKIEQMRNTSRNHYIDHAGERLTLQEWAQRIGQKPHTILKRLRRGWSIERALS